MIRFLLSLSLILIAQQIVFSQESMPAKPVVCTFSTENSFTQILPEKNIQTNARLIATSNIEVTYVDFPDQAKTAFEQAVLLWESYLISSQTIRIKATWTTTLTSSTLAVSGTTRIYKNFLNAPFSNVWYPTALAEALSGKDLNSGDYDINVSLNGNINWYYGIDAKAQAGKYDLITITMHEIAHGLGISSSMEVMNSDTQGQYGQSGSAYVYDVFMQDAQKIKLTNTGVYGNPSQDLKRTLTSNALYFGLKNTKFSNALPRLYAPTTYKSGVSFSHFDETTYPSGNNNSLMSPNVRAAEVNQNPGELLLNCLNEMGWQINGLLGYVVTDTESIPEPNLEVKVFPNPVEDVVNVAFPLLNQPRKVKVTLLNQNGQLIEIIENQLVTSETYSINVSNLPEGIYLLQILDGEKLTIKKIVK